MRITRKSLISGKVQTMDIPVTQAELDAYDATGVSIQDQFPQLTPEQREFIKSGITAEEWATLPKEEDDEPSEDEGEAMNDRQSPSIDAIFWVGNEIGAALVNYTTGRAYALITRTGVPFHIRLFLGWSSRFRFWRKLLPYDRKETAWLFFSYVEAEFESMLEAVVEADQILEAQGVIPQRVEAWERYYLLRPNRQGKDRERAE